MISRLRRRHLRVWLVLVCLIPVVLLAAWWSRRPPSLADRLPAALQEGGAR